MSGILQQVTASLIKDGEFIGNCVLFIHNDTIYALTAGHNLYGKDFSSELELDRFRIKLENEIELSFKTSVSNKVFSKKHDLSLIEIEKKKSEVNTGIVKLSFSSMPDNKIISLTIRGRYRLDKRINNYNGVKFDEQDIETSSCFFADIDKKMLVNHQYQYGAEWLNGLSGSGLFYENTNNLTCVGILTRIPDSGNAGKLKFTSINPIIEFFTNLDYTEFKDLKPKFKTKIHILESDKKIFLGSLEDSKIFLKRLYRKDNNVESNYSFHIDKSKVNHSLETLTKKFDKLVILGNPGIGKSTELERISNSLWEDKEDEWIPVYRNLRNFTIADTVHNYMNFDTIKEFEKLIFILDGLDEMPDSKDFVSKLESFISNSDIKDRNFKFLLSCRTNIFEGLVSKISEFKTYFLKELSPFEGVELLEKLTGEKFETQELIFNKLISEFLKNPFQIKVLARYYKDNNNSLPDSVVNLWSSYIENRLKFDKEDKLFKISLNTHEIKSNAKKISLVNEFMQTNIFNEENLYKVLKDNRTSYNEFLVNPLIDKISNSDDWFFEHRNIQEYFSASSLIVKSFAEIIKTITIEGTNNTHPSLYNVIIFMINLLDTDSECFKDLISWLKENEPELLFKADSDRNSKFKIEVFQDYFNKYCVEKTLWIGANNSLSEDEIAKFADCPENFEYLLKFIVEDNIHFRVKTSAINLLANFNVPQNREEEIRELFVQILQNPMNLSDSKIEGNLKSLIIRCIISFKFHLKHSNIINSIIDIFKDDDSSEVNRSIIALFTEIDNVDHWFKYFHKEFRREFGFEKRANEEYTHFGYNYLLQEIILKLMNSENFIEISSYYISNYNLRSNEDYVKKIIKRCVSFSETEPDFIIRFVKKAFKKNGHVTHENMLTQIIRECKKEKEVFVFLLEGSLFSEVKWLLAEIADSETIVIIIDKYNYNLIPDISDINGFRNILSHRNGLLAIDFQNLMIENGYDFKGLVLTVEENDIKRDQLKLRVQDDFDVLFNRKEIIKRLKNIYKENNLKKIDRSIISEIETKWYETQENWSDPLVGEVEFLHTLVFEKRSITIGEINDKTINNPTLLKFIHKKIISQISGNRNIQFLIDEKHKNQLVKWIKSVVKTFEVNGLIAVTKFSSFSVKEKESYDLINTILYFYMSDLFDFELEDSFLLNCIELYEIEKSDEYNTSFSSFLNKIKNQSKAKIRIVENLKKNLFTLTLTKHILYALDNKIVESYPLIQGFYKDDKSIYSSDRLFERYIQVTGDNLMLKNHCTDMNNISGWTCLNILLDQDENDFCIQKSLDYLNSTKDEYNQNALKILFKLKRPEAIKFHVNFFDQNLLDSFRVDLFSEYFELYNNEYEIIEKLFHLTYSQDRDSIQFSNNHSFFQTYTFNLSKNKNHYEKIKIVLSEIKEKLDVVTDDVKLFFLNSLIDNSTKSHISAMSKPLKFDEALLKVNSIIN